MKERAEELGIVLAHISPSLEGLRLVFVMPEGMSLAEAQAWMASQLGDEQYDSCVKDYARCSFVVPRGYVLWVDEEKLFAENSLPLSEGTPSKTEGELVDSNANQKFLPLSKGAAGNCIINSRLGYNF